MGLFTAPPSAPLMRDSERPPFQIIANVTDTLWGPPVSGSRRVEASREGGRCCIIDVGSCLKSAYCAEFPTPASGSTSITIISDHATMEKKEATCFVDTSLLWRSSGETLPCRRAKHNLRTDCSCFRGVASRRVGGNKPFNKTNGCL